MEGSGPHEIALDLLVWLSPGFPVGAFAYSHGLETAVDGGDVHDAASLRAWLFDLMEHGSIKTDTILAAAAWSSSMADDAVTLYEANELALAISPARERRLETSATGQAFVTAIRASWPEAVCRLLPHGELAYPIAFGATCGARKIVLLPCLEAYVLAFVQNLISAGVRLGCIGQTEGQRTIASLFPLIRTLAALAASASIDDVGGCALRSDLAAMQHETLYSRLFRS